MLQILAVMNESFVCAAAVQFNCHHLFVYDSPRTLSSALVQEA